MSTKIFIVDDHYMVIEGIRSLLQNASEIEWMGHASNARSCMAFLKKEQPDVLLLDINLPDISGLDLCRDILRDYPDIRILAISSFSQHSYVRKMMSHGAKGYLLKNASRDEIIHAISEVMNGKSFLSSELAEDADSATLLNIPTVTRREKEVLMLIAQGLTNQQIADKLFISPATVDTHRTSLLAKFEVKNTASLIRLAGEYNLL